MAFHAQHVRAALVHLKKRDPVLRDLIRRVGPFTLRAKRDHFGMLVRSIVSQQISVAAARTILQRLTDSLEPDGLCPHRISRLDHGKLRKVGISNQKAGYLVDLAAKVADGTVELKRLARAGDEAVIEGLTQIKGIGVWTAQMFLIFSLGRLDVLPVGDLGLKKAVQQQWKMDDLPDADDLESIAQSWRPYASIATWYLWRSLDNGTPGG